MVFDGSTLLIKPKVQIYKIPPMTTNRGHKAAAWGLETPGPCWEGRLRILAQNEEVHLMLEDMNTGQLFAEVVINSFPSPCIEPVLDSSRYFAINIKDPTTGRTAWIGLGFQERNDSFDFNASLQDHYRWFKQERQIQNDIDKAKSHPEEKLDLGFKDGQSLTIKVGKKIGEDGQPVPNVGSGRRGNNIGSSDVGDGITLLPPPPPGGTRRK